MDGNFDSECPQSTIGSGSNYERLRETLVYAEGVRLDREARKADGFLYVIGCEEYVKIGISKDVAKRFEGLRGSNPYPLTLLASVYCEDAKKYETQLHEGFANFRTSGEWFKLPEKVLKEFLESLPPASKPQRSVISALALKLPRKPKTSNLHSSNYYYAYAMQEEALKQLENPS